MSVPVFLSEVVGQPAGEATARAAGDHIVLDGPEGHHAATVRRMRPGERLDLTDGAGHVAECVVVDVRKDRLTAEVLRWFRVEPPRPRLIMVQGLPKGDRGELAVEMMTEAGVDVIVPWAATRCVTQWKGDRALKALGRWRSTAREAAKQSRRFHLPEVTAQAGTARVAELIASAGFAVVLHEEATQPLSGLALDGDGPGDIVVVVGPEGGITEEEIDRFRAAGAVPALLGPTVLRTSTAGVAAAAVVLSRCGRW